MILVEFGHHIFSSFLETKEVITVSDFSKHFQENNTNFIRKLNIITLDYLTESSVSTARTKSESAASRIKSC